MDSDSRITRRELILGTLTGLASLVSVNSLEASFSKGSYKKDNNVMADLEKDRKERAAYSRQNMIMEYYEWKTLVENPDSLEGQRALSKSKKISLTREERLIHAMTDDEKRDYKTFRDTFNLDIVTLRDKLLDEKKEFMELVFPIILDMQLELDSTYKTLFNYTCPRHGDYVLWFFHFRHSGTYAKEGKTIPSHLNKKQKELDKEDKLK